MDMKARTMSKSTILVFLVALYLCNCAIFAHCESLNSRGSGTAAGSSAKKLRLVYSNLPSTARLYHLKAGLNSALDDEDLLVEDETVMQKRQYDDYGHMRFGKRNPKDFDDYGHLRFGK